MARMMEQEEQELMWESVEILLQIDMEKAKAVLKATIEKTFRQINLDPSILFTIRLADLNSNQLTGLREIERNIRGAYKNEKQEEAYVHLVDFIEQLSVMIDGDSTVTRKKLFAFIIAQNYGKPAELNIKRFSPLVPPVNFMEGDKKFYTSSEAAEKLGLSDQTIRRMCEKGKFPGAYKTDGGHWRIPQEAFITTPEQDERASEVLQRIDLKNKEAGDINEFDL